MNIVFYNSYDIFLNPKNKEKLNLIPGGNKFSSYFKIFSTNISAIDRTNTLIFPLKTKVLPNMSLPVYQVFNKNFDEICDDRAKQLLQITEQQNKKIVVMYSGGIDSTLILCSFLKNFSNKQLKNVIVLLSDESIRENPNFYYDHVIKHFNCVSSYRFVHYLGHKDYFFISGENADQLFGSQVNQNFSKKYSYEKLFSPLENMDQELVDYFNSRLSTEERSQSEFYLSKFKKLISNSPVPIDNVYKFFWWINFTTKWQSVYVRMLPYATNTHSLVLEENYTSFYCTDEFQLWSLNNTDKFIKNDFNSIKYVAKDYIFSYNKDESYLKKPKIGSLFNLMQRKEMIYTIDESLKYGLEYPTTSSYNYENDFI